MNMAKVSALLDLHSSGEAWGDDHEHTHPSKDCNHYVKNSAGIGRRDGEGGVVILHRETSNPWVRGQEGTALTTGVKHSWQRKQ